MSTARTRLALESLHQIEPSRLLAEFFINPAIALMESYNEPPYSVDVRCDQIKSSLINSQGELPIEIGWEATTFPEAHRLLKTIQRESIVEYSAIAVAFLLVTEIATCIISEVTLRGDKADYFLNDRSLMLEVSGTEDPRRASSRHDHKVGQLLANPYGRGGYVVVCSFSTNSALFSFHSSPNV